MRLSKIRIVLVGGGTGGHFYPLMSIAELLSRSEEHPTLYYMGPEPYDADTLTRLSISFVRCPAGKRRRYFSLQNYLDIFKTLWGIIVAIRKLFVIYPDVVVSKGGYTSVPVVIAARLLAIPIIVHESDAVPGAANKLGARFARNVLTAYEEVQQYFPANKISLIGIPIRKELLGPPSGSPLGRFNVGGTEPVILVLGGSQGAERLNELILDSLDELLTSYQVIHQTGTLHFDVVQASARQLIPNDELFARYHPVAFMDPVALNDALHGTSLVISRAGSGTIHEIAVHGKPSILVPIPENISHDQQHNAFAYARSGGATVMEEANLSDDLLMAEIARIMKSPEIYAEMATGAKGFARTNAAEMAATLILEIGKTH